MGMSIISRTNLQTTYTCLGGCMISPGTFLYRASNSGGQKAHLRTIVSGGSDTAVIDLDTVGFTSSNPGYMEIFENAYVVWAELIVKVCYALKISDLSLSEISLSSGSTSCSRIVGYMNSGIGVSTDSTLYWCALPLLDGSKVTGTAPQTGRGVNVNGKDSTGIGGYIFGGGGLHLPGSGWNTGEWGKVTYSSGGNTFNPNPQSYPASFLFPANLDTLGAPAGNYGYGTKDGTNSSPAGGVNDGSYVYTFCQKSTSPFEIVDTRWSADANAYKYEGITINDVSSTLQGGYSETNSGISPSQCLYNANGTYRRYFAAGSNLYRLYSSVAWPLNLSNSIDLDTSGGKIVGIAVDSPFVYVLKQGGGTFGQQLIKILDTGLTSMGALPTFLP